MNNNTKKRQKKNDKEVKYLNQETICKINDRILQMSLDYDLPIYQFIDRPLKDWQKKFM